MLDGLELYGFSTIHREGARLLANLTVNRRTEPRRKPRYHVRPPVAHSHPAPCTVPPWRPIEVSISLERDHIVATGHPHFTTHASSAATSRGASRPCVGSVTKRSASS